MNTHFGLIAFSGDPASEHPDEELRGHAPSLELIAAGPEFFCWQQLEAWTTARPLRQWEWVEVVQRDPEVVLREFEESEQCGGD